MTVVVSKKGVKVKANGKYHSLGETISGLSEAEEKRLAEGGTCKYVSPPVVSPDPAPEDTEEKKVPDVAKEAKVTKASGNKKNKEVDGQVGNDDNEPGPDTSHPLV